MPRAAGFDKLDAVIPGAGTGARRFTFDEGQMSRATRCPYCGLPVDGGAVICRTCWEHLPVAPPAPEPTSTARPRTEGRVRWYNRERGYGFVTADDGTDCLVHTHAIERGPLVNRGRVEFDVIAGDAGPMATRVVALAGPAARRTQGTVALAIAQGRGGAIINDDDGNAFLLYNGNEITEGPLPFVDGARVVFGVVPGSDELVNIVVIAEPGEHWTVRREAITTPRFVLMGSSTYEGHQLTR